MEKLKFFIIGFVTAGIIIGGFNLYKDIYYKLYWFRRDVKLADGLLIPKGTEVRYEGSMPEGYNIYSIEFRIMGGHIDDILEKVLHKDEKGPIYWIDSSDIKQNKESNSH